MINIINHTSFKFKIGSLKKESQKLLKSVKTHYSENSSSIINIAFITSEEIIYLNSSYRKKKSITDVLTFPDSEKSFSGDIAVCIEKVYADATDDKKDKGYYLAETILHGMLHLFGLEHDYSDKDLKKVYAIQKKLIKMADIDKGIFSVK